MLRSDGAYQDSGASAALQTGERSRAPQDVQHRMIVITTANRTTAGRSTMPIAKQKVAVATRA
jgi:hypothetical protein